MSRSRKARVARGAALLDEVRPGWARRIKLRRLEMNSGYYNPEHTDPDDREHCGCILAQLDSNGGEGTYWKGLRALGVNSQAFGFHVYDRERWSPFTELWKDEVRARR